ncbi:hypothetical protein [Aquirufa nivalisilvae]|uniref:hypothetical protein n=1 Tax=Aquirufa nivalisilvae TaxID=2516557 RepID=UPI001032A171|nr:hypothetical protein [Aquirufa nivalisilvae]TBH76572.1 hypothetical protein EWU22_03275 [Aquirufa nivalisilvae]
MKHFLFLILISFIGKSQVLILDNTSQKPISNVEVFNNKGILLTTTNENGEIDLIKEEDFPVTFSHFLYHNFESKSFSKVVNLSPKSIILNDVVVKGNPNKYIIIEGYYRGFQTKNDTLDVFADAKIKWIISTWEKESVGYEILASRFLLSKKYKYYKQGKVFFGMRLNTLPHLQTDFKNFTKNTNALVSFHYEENNGFEKEIKFLGNSSKIILNQDEIFSTSVQYPFENLKFFNHKHKLIFSSKKSHVSDRYEAIDEFIPSQIYFSNELPRNFQKKILISGKSNFDSNFWKEFEENRNFKKLSSAINNSLENSMELIK